MPRIRTIKPEFWTSEQVADCSTTVRLLFVGLWNFCDDAGRHVASLKRLKMEVFPGDSFTVDEMAEFVTQLIDAELMVEYESQGRLYWQVTGWHHQKIDKPNIKYPSPDSGTIRRPFDDHSTTIRRPFDDHSPPEGSLRESKGKESKGKDSPVVDQSTTEPCEDFPPFPVVGKPKEWFLSEHNLTEWISTYEHLDVRRSLREARQWLIDNPRRRKTPQGMTKFLGGWLARNQNGARGSPNGQRQPIQVPKIGDYE